MGAGASTTEVDIFEMLKPKIDKIREANPTLTKEEAYGILVNANRERIDLDDIVEILRKDYKEILAKEPMQEDEIAEPEATTEQATTEQATSKPKATSKPAISKREKLQNALKAQISGKASKYHRFDDSDDSEHEATSGGGAGGGFSGI